MRSKGSSPRFSELVSTLNEDVRYAHGHMGHPVKECEGTVEGVGCLPLAFVVMNVEVGAEGRVLEELRKLGNVKEAHPVWGVYDIIVKVEAQNQGELREYISNIRQLHSVKGTLVLLKTEQSTCSHPPGVLHSLGKEV